MLRSLVLGLLLMASLVACSLPSDASAAPVGGTPQSEEPTPTPTVDDPTPTPTLKTDGSMPTPSPVPTATPAPTPTPTLAPTPTATPEQERTGLLPSETAIYLTVSLGTENDVLNAVAFGTQQEWLVPAGNIVVETSYRGVLMYVPTTNEARVLATYTSPSYAPHVRRPYTIGDRLFINTEWTSSGRLDVDEYDPLTNQVIATSTHGKRRRRFGRRPRR